MRVRVRVRSEGGSSHTSAANRQSRKQKGRKEKREEKKIRDTQTKVASFFCLFFFPKEKKNQLNRVCDINKLLHVKPHTRHKHSRRF